MVEPTKNIFDCDLVQGVADGLIQVLFRPCADHTLPLNLDHNSSIGLSSELYGGSRKTVAFAFLIYSSTPGTGGPSDCRRPPRRLASTPTPAPDQRTPERPSCRWPRRRPKGSLTPSNPIAAITVFALHMVGTDPPARSPCGAQAWLRVMDVFTPVSFTKTSRFGLICPTLARYRRRFWLAPSRPLPLAGVQGLLLEPLLSCPCLSSPPLPVEKPSDGPECCELRHRKREEPAAVLLK